MTDFPAIVALHRARYPLMQPQDLIKLAYQSAYGAEHLIADPDAFCQALHDEWRRLPAQEPLASSEEIGNGRCRVYLSPSADVSLATPLLARLVLDSPVAGGKAQETFGEMLSFLEGDDETRRFLRAYRAQGYGAVHHSAAYRTAYRPHYRVIGSFHSALFPVCLRIAQLLQEKRPVLVSVDGRCGSGKTSAAAILGKIFDGAVFHMDDYYLPPSQRPANWEQTPAGNMDLTRFSAEVLAPAKAGQMICSPHYSCEKGDFLPAAAVPPHPLTIVEGSYSQHPLLAAQYDLRVFLTCDPQVQLQRLHTREGAYTDAFLTRWIPMEERYFSACSIAARTHYLIDTGHLF